MSISLGGLSVNYISVINLSERKDRRQAFRKQIRKKKLKQLTPHFYSAVSDRKDPERGRFQSHLNVIKMAKNNHYKNILIFEDDARVYVKNFAVPTPPKDWQMLYLGGKLEKQYEDETESKDEWRQYYVKGCVLTTHAYIVNHTMFDVILREGSKYLGDVPLDEFYCRYIHPDYPTYLTVPEYVGQFDGYSDVQRRKTTYSQTLTKTLDDTTVIDEVPVEVVKCVDDDGEEYTETKLSLPELDEKDLPLVTLVTPMTNNRRKMFDLSVYCFYRLDYPENKLRWIIADDCDEEQRVRDLIPGDDPRIQYINCKMKQGNYLPVTKKINLAIEKYSENSKKHIIVNFFDSVYYPSHTVLSRVKTLLANPEKSCVGCTEFGVFEFVKNRSYISYYADSKGNKTLLELSSMAYYKEWWKDRKFDETSNGNPVHQFTIGRLDKCIQLPYLYVMYILHCDKFNNTQKIDTTSSSVGFFETFAKEVQEFILILKELHK